MKQKTGIQVKSADTKIIEHRFRNTSFGDLVTYDELSTLLGRDVRQFCYGNIRTAVKALMKESIFLDCVAGEGYKRLNDSESVTALEHYRVKARRTVRRGIVHLQNIACDKLTDQDKLKYFAMGTQLQAMELFSGSKAANRIESAVKEQSKQMAIGETLKLFGG